MKRKWMAILIAVVMIVSLTACGAGEETTVSGIVVSVDGTVISLMEMDGTMGGKDVADGEKPEKPGGMEGSGAFNPEDADGTLPEGETFPQREEGERPELPEGETFPQREEGDMPELPENGNRPNGNGDNATAGGFDTNAETKSVDIGSAHISVEIDDGKATGSMDDIKAGVFVTVTMNGRGEVTNVLVSSRSFGGGGNRRPTN